ncbi:MAG: hypothetical protein ACYTGZ_09095 [Planctomycetota bacterium]|jgi:hypothetical protein
MNVEDDRYADVVFPEYYEDIFLEDDADFRFRLIRSHIHPKLRVLLAGCMDTAAEIFETDPMTFSKMRREPKTFEGDPKRIQCALYGLRPNEVRGKGFPNLRSSSGRPRQVAEFDLSFFADRDGLGLELHIARRAELALLQEVYAAYRDSIDALLTFVRLGVDGPVRSRLVSLNGMIENVKSADDAWIAIFEPRYPFPIAARDFMSRFEDCFLALYLIYDAMLSRALGIEDKFEAQFEMLEARYRPGAAVDEEPPEFEV